MILKLMMCVGLLHFGLEVITDIDSYKLAGSDYISRETLFEHCQLFWNIIRKEDMIVERIAWALSTKDEENFLDIQGFLKFFRIFI